MMGGDREKRGKIAALRTEYTLLIFRIIRIYVGVEGVCIYIYLPFAEGRDASHSLWEGTGRSF
jgi:hypothetical protein